MDETQNGDRGLDDETETNESTGDVLAVLGSWELVPVIGARGNQGLQQGEGRHQGSPEAVKEKRDAKERHRDDRQGEEGEVTLKG